VSVRDFLLSSLDDGGSGPVSVVLPAPAAPESVLATLFPGEDASVFLPPDGRRIAGVGIAASVEGRGAARYAEVRAGARHLLERTSVRAADGFDGIAPVLLGGLAFAPGWGLDSDPWRAFGDATFALHRWTYERRTRPVLTLTVDRDAGYDAEGLLGEHDRIVTALASYDERGAAPAPHPGSRGMVQMSLVDWINHIRAIEDEFASGAFTKLVAARRCEVRLGEQIDPAAVLERLARGFGDCTAFWFRRGGVSFVGATPETLFTCSGSKVHSQALAGSLMAGQDEASTRRQTQLLETSRKNLAEHRFVVSEIVASLEEHCTRVERPPEPSVLRVRNLLHLNTPIDGELRDGVHPVDLMEVLHPTPAMGGVPRLAAVDWIAAHERDPRGWYTGPIGWFDAAGDAELKVAIRCGVLDGALAHVYTGAGIVPGSNPRAEYHETAMKQRPFLRAIGAL